MHATHTATTPDWLGVRAGALGLLLPLAKLKAVQPLPKLAQVPRAPAWLLGVLRREEGVLLVADVARLLAQAGELNSAGGVRASSTGGVLCVLTELADEPVSAPTTAKRPGVALYFDAMVGLLAHSELQAVSKPNQPLTDANHPTVLGNIWWQGEARWHEINLGALLRRLALTPARAAPPPSALPLPPTGLR